MKNRSVAFAALFVGIFSFSFASARSQRAPDEVHFAVIGDFGISGSPERDIAHLVKSWAPDFIITTGDNNYPDGALETIDINIGQYYHDFIYPYSGKYGKGADRNRFFPSLGNHDWGTPNAQPYLDYFTLPGNERTYDFVWGPVHFFSIDSDHQEPTGRIEGSAQALWLKNHLATSTSTWNVVYMHHPPYSSGNHHGSDVEMQWPYKEWGADIVLAGHEHNYERLSVDGFPYIVIGISGNKIYGFRRALEESVKRYNEDWGALRAMATNKLLRFQLITRSGTVIDSLTLRKGN